MIEHEDLMYLARQVAKSIRRREEMVNLGDKPGARLVLDREKKLLADRRRQLGLLVDSARITGDLPTKDALLRELSVHADEATDMSAESAVSCAVLLEAVYPDKPVPQQHHSITAQPIERFQLGQ